MDLNLRYYYVFPFVTSGGQGANGNQLSPKQQKKMFKLNKKVITTYCKFFILAFGEGIQLMDFVYIFVESSY